MNMADNNNFDSINLSFLTRIAHMEAKLKELRQDIKIVASNHADQKEHDRISNTSKWNDPSMPVSFRNNNPGNLRPTADGKNRWRGELNTDNGYACFKDMTHGTRALMYLLKISYPRHQCNTIDSIVDRFAPPGKDYTENSKASVEGYKNFLYRHMGHHDNPCDFENKRVLFTFARGIALFESGKRVTPLSGDTGLAILEKSYGLLPA